MTSPLYFCESGTLSGSDFVTSLRQAGIKTGDSIFVHSDIGTFGKLATFDRTFLLNAHVEALKEVIGKDGTLLMPTFSYSFCDNKMFHVQETPSKVGVLSDYFWRMPGVSRSRHPIFSAAGWGKRASEFLDVGKDSFDDESIFGKLRKGKAKLLFYGVDLRGCTFIHHIEQMHGISYRYFKTFSGIVRDHETELPEECTFFVRYLDRKVVLDTRPFEDDLVSKGIVSRGKIGHGPILCGISQEIFDEGWKHLDRNEFFFLKEPPQ